MVDQLRSWFRENHTLVIFLIAQALAIGTAAAAILAYAVKLETRVYTMETSRRRIHRGADGRDETAHHGAGAEPAGERCETGEDSRHHDERITKMRGDRLREILGEIRGLVEQAQAAMDDRPALQRVLTTLREKVRTVEDAKPEGDETDQGEDEDETEDKRE